MVSRTMSERGGTESHGGAGGADESGMRPASPELAVINPRAMRGLEIGPLANPRIRKDDGAVLYLDHASTEELRSKYEGNDTMSARLSAIVDVDFVQREGESLVDVLTSEERFDYVLASHVIEHVPNLIGWLNDVSSILRVGGILSLVIPDKRFTFDVNRTPTEMSEVIDDHLRDIRHPSSRQIFDFMARTVTIDGMVDTPGLWDGVVNYSGVVRSDVLDPDIAAFDVCLEHHAHPEQAIDVHCHVFTPASFLQLLSQMMNLELIDFEVAAYFPTVRNQLEFFVSLRKVESEDDSRSVRVRQLESITALDLRADAPTIRTPERAVAEEMILSPLEHRLITANRRILYQIRNGIRRWR